MARAHNSKSVGSTAPAAVTDLDVFATTSSSIMLTWTATADDTGDKTAAYDIRYSTAPIDAGGLQVVAGIAVGF